MRRESKKRSIGIGVVELLEAEEELEDEVDVLLVLLVAFEPRTDGLVGNEAADECLLLLELELELEQGLVI